MHTINFSNAEDFLNNCHDNQIGCAILDIGMPHITGLALQHMLKQREINNIPLAACRALGSEREKVNATDQNSTISQINSGKAVDYGPCRQFESREFQNSTGC